VPERSGEKGPSPLSAWLTSTTLPPLLQPIETPPPIVRDNKVQIFVTAFVLFRIAPRNRLLVERMEYADSA
jgi:hypothetical protein